MEIGAMTIVPRKVKGRKSDRRRQSLIDATLAVIARDGVRAATVRTIAAEANVTQGLIRYYFQTKDELITHAYGAFRDQLMQYIVSRQPKVANAKDRLIHWIEALMAPQLCNSKQISTWSGFFEILLHDKAMIESHTQNYQIVRQSMKAMIMEVLKEEGRSATDAELRRLSIACTALLSGVWVEGGAIPKAFHPNELQRTGIEGVGILIGVDLKTYYSEHFRK
jgi:AcrR family transcriptional regulator